MKSYIKTAYAEKVITTKGRVGIKLSRQQNWTILMVQWPISMLTMHPMRTYSFVVIGQSGSITNNDMKLKAIKSPIPSDG
jgi:hypothetical protein